jgi:hypothetical protein
MSAEFKEFINSKNPYYEKLVTNYQKALDTAKNLKKEDPKAFEKALSNKNLDDRVVQKHPLIKKLANEQFGTKNKAQNKAMVKTR